MKQSKKATIIDILLLEKEYRDTLYLIEDIGILPFHSIKTRIKYAKRKMLIEEYKYYLFDHFSSIAFGVFVSTRYNERYPQNNSSLFTIVNDSILANLNDEDFPFNVSYNRFLEELNEMRLKLRKEDIRLRKDNPNIISNTPYNLLCIYISRVRQSYAEIKKSIYKEYL